MKTDSFDSTWTGDNEVEKNGRHGERLKDSEHRQHGQSHRIITWLNDNPDNEGGLTRRMIHELYVSAENIFCRFCEAWGHRKGECHMMRRGEKRGRRMRRKKMTPEELPRYREEERERERTLAREAEYFKGIQKMRQAQKERQKNYDDQKIRREYETRGEGDRERQTCTRETLYPQRHKKGGQESKVGGS